MVHFPGVLRSHPKQAGVGVVGRIQRPPQSAAFDTGFAVSYLDGKPLASRSCTHHLRG